MNLREIPFKKPVKLLILLLSSILIATTSAAVYYSLSMQPEVTVSTPAIRFENGTDTTATSTVTDAWCRLKLKSYPNASLTYDDAVNISNTDGSTHSFRLKHSGITPNDSITVGNWSYIKFIIIDENETVQASLNYTTSGGNWTIAPANGETDSLTIPANTDWTVKVITKSTADAKTNETCYITMSVDVDE